MRSGQQAQGFVVEVTQLAGVVHAAPRMREERPLDVNAQYTRHTLRDGGAHGLDGLSDHVQVVTDQRRQETRGPEAPVRGADRGDGFDAGMFVEQHAAAAVHLRVEEAGCQHAALEVYQPVGTRDAAGADHGLDAAIAHQQGLAGFEAVVGQYPAVAECLEHQIVSVTLFRCGGRSGSSPRARASAFAAR
jgi:hypothetical protein